MVVTVLAKEIRALPWTEKQKLLQILDREEARPVRVAARRDREMDRGVGRVVPVKKFFQAVRARLCEASPVG